MTETVQAFFAEIELGKKLREVDYFSEKTVLAVLLEKAEIYQLFLQTWNHVRSIWQKLDSSERNGLNTHQITDRLLICLLHTGLGLTRQPWLPTDKIMLPTETCLHVSHVLQKHWSFSATERDLLEKIVKHQLLNPQLHFEDIFLTVIPEEGVFSKEDYYFDTIGRARFLERFLLAYTDSLLNRFDPIQVQFSNRSHKVELHINQVSRDPQVQRHRTSAAIEQYFAQNPLRSGWKLTGLSPLIGRRHERFLDYLADVANCDPQTLVYVGQIDPWLPLSTQSSTLRKTATQKKMVTVAIKNLEHSSRYQADFITTGTLPLLGYFEMST